MFSQKYEGIIYTYLFLAEYEMKNEVFNLYNSLYKQNIKNVMFDFIVPSDRRLVPKEYVKDLSMLDRVSIESI